MTPEAHQAETQPERTRRLQADLMLLSVSVIWGSAFVAQRIAAVQSGVFWFNGLRFLLGALVLLPFYIFRRKQSTAIHLAPSRVIPGMLLAGAFLWAGAALQQAGLQYTTAGNAGFITGLYVVLIPVFLAVFWRRPARPTIWIAAGMAAIGLYLLSTGGQLAKLNPGDLLELAGAVMWALHVILIGTLVQRMDVLQLVIGQYLVCAALSLLTGLIVEMDSLPGIAESWGAILYTGILSVGVGYTLQATGQRVAPPADAAIILSTEAVFAALFGWLILDEILAPVQLLGCAVIFTGMLLAQADAFRVMRAPSLILILIIAMIIAPACSTATPTTFTATATRPLLESPTASTLPTTSPLPRVTSTPSPVQATATLAMQLCSPLSGYDLNQLPSMVANPYDPPPPGRDDPHEGIDLAVTDPSLGMALSGAPVQAVLGGRAVMMTNDRFPYGNALIIETPLETIHPTWTGMAAIPTPAPLVTPHAALTCPQIEAIRAPQTDQRSLYLVYAHLKEPVNLQPGDAVACGQTFGNVGDSGNALNPHLHLEARVGPSGARFDSMAHYDASATPEEMAAYCLWKVSGAFQLIDPLQLILSDP